MAGGSRNCGDVFAPAAFGAHTGNYSAKVLKSAEFGADFALSSQAEHLERVWVLSFDDEFREGIAFKRIQEKIRQDLA